MAERIYIYDTMLRDGIQTQGVDVSVLDKQEISQQLDDLGIDYIEGGWPGANPTDDAFFAKLPKLKKSKIVAFGMTRKIGRSAENDPGLNALLNTGVKSVCIVGKASEAHAKNALHISLKENLSMISDSISYLSKKGAEVIFDAEHFFDGYKSNAKYSLEVVKAAYEAGARWVVLCDTNGGTLPHEIDEIVRKVVKEVPGSHLSIHCHNDTENAVANSIAAVRAGVRQVQGTINGWGERCGNANLITLMATLKLKMGYDVGVSKAGLKKLTELSHSLEDRLNKPRYRHAAYVGASAFAHKGGLHVSAVVKDPGLYEHIDPELIGNERLMLVSDQAGKANIINRIKTLGIKLNLEVEETQKKISALVKEVKEREKQGYSYDSADASFELLARRVLGKVPEFYDLRSFRVIDERRWNAKGKLITNSEAKVKMSLGGKELMEIAEGNGPVNALNKALKKALTWKYKELDDIRLVDYKVRIIKPEEGTGAITRVQIETADNDGDRWTTIGVSANIIDASYNALYDSFIYKLLRSKRHGKK